MLRVISARVSAQRSAILVNRKFSSTGSGQQTNDPLSALPSVEGLSNRVVNVPNTPVGYAGSTKDSEYKCPEYFCYHTDSFGDSIVELEKYRLPAPSNKKRKSK